MNGQCPETGKKRYATARAAHLAVQQAYWGKRSKEQPRRVYFCKRCQGYHLTSNGDLWGRRSRLQVIRKRKGEDGVEMIEAVGLTASRNQDLG